jgi:hypothetical protein
MMAVIAAFLVYRQNMKSLHFKVEDRKERNEIQFLTIFVNLGQPFLFINFMQK